mgnify:CR=1 FL=1
MEVRYASKTVEQQCTSVKAANKLFGGKKILTEKLMSRVNALKAAPNLKDIVLMKNLRFHDLEGDLSGLFAIDVKTQKDKWRIILRPLDQDENEFNPCNIDEIAEIVKIIRIEKVSAHYE